MVGVQIINKVLKTKDIDLIIKNDLTEQHFIGCEAYYNFLMNHYRRYGNIPDIPTFLDKFEDFELLDVTETDEYLIDKIQEEYLYSEMVPVIQDSLVYDDINEYGAELLVVEVTLRPAIVAKLGITDVQKYMDEKLAEFNKTVFDYEKIAKVIIRTEDFVRSPSMKIVRKKRALQ